MDWATDVISPLVLDLDAVVADLTNDNPGVSLTGDSGANTLDGRSGVARLLRAANDNETHQKFKKPVFLKRRLSTLNC